MVETVFCAEYSGTFTKSFCAASHARSNTPEGIAAMFRVKCRRCLTGANSLGTDQYIDRSVLFGSKFCARCERQSLRLVRGVVCVSCYNRELENAVGLNKHGNPLKLIRHYHMATVAFLTRDGKTKKREFKVMGENEAMRSLQLTEPDFINIKSIDLAPIKSPNKDQKAQNYRLKFKASTSRVANLDPY
jgi:hypothetical protein